MGIDKVVVMESEYKNNFSFVCMISSGMMAESFVT